MISVNLRSASELLRKCIQIADSYKIATPNNLKSYVDFESSFDKIKFKNGSRIITLPAGSPESLRGFSGSLILDEFALVENDKLIW
jgi:phage FluMu gp28-like protein